MKIAYLVNQYPRTSHSFVRREIHAVEALGIEVLRFSQRPLDEALATDADREELAKTRVVLAAGVARHLVAVVAALLRGPAALLRAVALAVRIGWRSERGLLRHLVYLAEAAVLERWLREAGVAHVHAHFGTNSAAVAMLCQELGGPPYSFTVHGPDEFDKPEFLALGEKIRHAAFVVAISSFGRAQLCRWARYEDWAKIHVVHCGLEEGLLRAAVTPVPAAPRLVCVARLSPQKGHLLLLEAAARIAAEGLAFEVVLAGDGPMRAEIERQIQRLGLERRVRVGGWMSADRVREEIVASRALVLPSFAEGLPVVIMEALALGRPVITTAIAGTPELVRPGETGWVVPAGSVEALVPAMRAALVAAPDELRRMGKTGAALVAEQHDVKEEARKLAALFERAAHGGRAATIDGGPAAPASAGGVGADAGAAVRASGGAGRHSARLGGLLLAVLLASSAAAAPPAEAEPETNHLGLNFTAPLDYMPAQVYADVIRQSRDVKTADGAALAPVDEDGFPLAQDFRIGVGTGIANMHGDYTFSATGRARSLTSTGKTVIGPHYDSGTNTTTAVFRFREARKDLNIMIWCRGCERSDGTGRPGLTDIHLMRPVFPGATETHDRTELFNRNLVSILREVRVIRFMDFLATSGNQLAEWRERPRPSWMAFSRHLPGDGWQGMGGPLEHVILLANALGRDAWICIPHKASDDYVRKAALLFAYGSDGVLPYTGPYGSAPDPVKNPRPAPHDPAKWTPGTTTWYPPLRSSLRLYVEYGNELWNSGSPFVIGHNWVIDAAKAEIRAGKSDLAYDGETNLGGARWVARRMKQISDVFRSVFGDAQMPMTGTARIRPVLASFQELAASWLGNGLSYLWEYWGNGDGVEHVPRPHPPRYYLWGAGGSSYARPGNKWTVDPVSLETIWSSNQLAPERFRALLAPEAHLCAGFGLKRVAYEGGPDFGAYQGHTDVMEAAWSDPRMKALVVEHQRVWSELGGDLNVLFTAVGDYQWGFTRDVAVAPGSIRVPAPKLEALVALAAARRAEPTLGVAVPGTAEAAGHSGGSRHWWIPSPGGKGFVHFEAKGGKQWANYVFRAAEPATRTVKLRVSNPSGAVEVFLDGVSLGRRPVDGGPVSLPAGVVTKGLHGVMVRAVSGRFTLHAVTVE